MLLAHALGFYNSTILCSFTETLTETCITGFTVTVNFSKVRSDVAKKATKILLICHRSPIAVMAVETSVIYFILYIFFDTMHHIQKAY